MFTQVRSEIRARLSEASHSPNINGFTLTEMLVATAIISLLAVFLVSGIRAVKSAATTSICASNLRQQHLAALIYAQDWKNNLPAATQPTNSSGGAVFWQQVLASYINNSKLYSVAGSQYGVLIEPVYRSSVHFTAAAKSTGNLGNTGYAINMHLPPSKFSTSFGQAQITNGSIPQIREPGATPLFAESYLSTASSMAPNWTLRTARDSDMNTFGGFIHRQRCNIVFIDGHLLTLTTSNYLTVYQTTKAYSMSQASDPNASW